MPPVYASDDPAEEMEMIRRGASDWDAARRRADSWPDETVGFLSRYASASPWMEPEAMLALAESGIPPDSEAGIAALEASGADYYQGFRRGREPGEEPPIRSRRSWWGQMRNALPGADVDIDGEMALKDPAVRMALQPTALETVLTGGISAADLLEADPDATWELYGEVHNGAMEIRQMLADQFGQEWVDEQREVTEPTRPDWITDDAEWEAARRRVTEGPQIEAGWAGQLRTGRFDPSAVTAEEFDQAVSDAQPGRDPWERVAIPVARVVGMAVNAPIQEMTGQFRETVEGVRRQGWAGYLTGGGRNVNSGSLVPESQSDLGIAAGQLAAGEDVDTGAGYFVAPESGVGQARFSRELSFGTIGGHALTPGRWGADLIPGLDPGDTGYGIASGVVDLAWQVGADPLNAVAGAGRAVAASRRAFTGVGSLGGEVIETTGRLAGGYARPGTLRRPVPEPDGTPPVRYENVPREAPAHVRREEAVGLLPRAPVPDLDPTVYSGWLLAGAGRPVVEALAGESNFTNLRRMTRGRIPSNVLLQIADTSDPTEVTRVLFDAMSRGTARFDRKFLLADAHVERGTWMRRAVAQTPPPMVRLDDPEGLITGLDAYLVNAQVPDEMIEPVLRRVAGARNELDRVDALHDGLRAVRNKLVDDGIDQNAAEAVTRLIIGEQRQNRIFWMDVTTGLDSMALPSLTRHIDEGGQVFGDPRAHLVSEMSPEVVQLPNIREIKRLTSVLGRVGPALQRVPLIPDELADFIAPVRRTTERGAMSGAELRPGTWQNMGRAVEFAEFASRALWKPLTLLRPAWLMRQIIMDEAGIRGGATGMPNIFSHPLGVFAAMFDKRMEAVWLKNGELPNGAFTGAQQHTDALMDNSILDSADARRIVQDAWDPLHKAADSATTDVNGYTGAWGRMLGQLAGDPSGMVPRLAGQAWQNGNAAEAVDDIVQALMHGDLADWVPSIGRRIDMSSEDAIRAYVQSLWDRLLAETGGNHELLEAVANGYIRSHDGRALYFSEPGKTKPSQGFVESLRRYVDQSGPQWVKKEREATRRGADVGMDAMKYIQAQAFRFLASAPSNALNRNPAWRYSYFRSMADQMPFLTETAQDAVLAQARQFRAATGFQFELGGRQINVGDRLMRDLESGRFRGDKRVTGTRDFDDAQLVGKFEAMERVQEIYGNFTTKGQTWDAMRVIMPFGSAWRESWSAYVKIIKDNPLILRRPHQGLQTATESGFFYADEQSGETMFAYPGSAWLMEHVPFLQAAPFPLTGRVRGLMMGFEVMPGLGPVATFPLAHLIPDQPRWDTLRGIVIPFGSEAGREFLVPEWMEKLAVAMENVQGDGLGAGAAHVLSDLLGGSSREAAGQWGSSVIDVMNYLASTGEYDLSQLSEWDRLEKDSKERAVHLWVWRGLVQSTAPSAPRWAAVILDADGDAVPITLALERLHELRDEDPQNATQRFLDEFGEMAFGLLAPKTESNALYTVYDQDGYDWVREHSGLMDTYERVGTLFAPMGGGDAGITAYIRRVEAGDVTPRDPAESRLEGQDALASSLYAQYRDQAQAAAEAAGYSSVPEPLQDWLRQQRYSLMDRYAGYMLNGRSAGDIETTINQLEQALGEEELAGTEAGQAIAEYLNLRAQAIDVIEQHPTADSLSTAAAAPLRLWLRQEGERLVAEHPSFVNAWDRVFLREVEIAEED